MITINESVLTEAIINSIKHVLNESAKDKRVLTYLKSRGYTDYNQNMQIIGSLKHDIPNIRLDDGKFVLAACRMYLDGQLRDEQSIRQLDNALKYIHGGGHTEEFDENLNDMSVTELNEMFRESRKQFGVNDRERSNARVFSGGTQYTIVPINSFEEAEPYGRYTEWCVTHGKDAFDSYTQGGNRFYFCLMKGFERVEEDDTGAPLNEYGLSMIAVNVDMNGDLTRVTTRYNHEHNGENNPGLETTEQLENVLNVPFYQTFKPYTRDELHEMGIILFDEVQALLDSGKKPKEIFEKVGEFQNGYARVKLNGKCNFISEEGRLVSPTWFDSCLDFENGYAKVELNDKWNFINTEGRLVSHTWFDSCEDFKNSYTRVKLNGKWNHINGDGYARVKLNGKFYYINTEGQLCDKPKRITESSIQLIAKNIVKLLFND